MENDLQVVLELKKKLRLARDYLSSAMDELDTERVIIENNVRTNICPKTLTIVENLMSRAIKNIGDKNERH